LYQVKEMADVDIPASSEHIGTIAERMREADRLEVYAASGKAPEEALAFSLRKSSIARTWVIDGRPEMMFGVGDLNVLAGVGAPWLLGTDAVLAHQMEFLRQSRKWRNQLLRRYSTLNNFVDVRNDVSVRWLRWLGFNVVLSATEGKPDQIASDLNLASEFGKVTGNPIPPLPLVQEARSAFQAEIERQKNSTILSSSPRLTEWLRNPDNASVAKDDLSGLSWWETPLAAAKNAVSRGVRRMPMTYNQMMTNAAVQRMQDQQQSFGDILASETDVRDENGALLYKGLPGPVDLLKAGSRYATSRFSSFVGPDAARDTAAYYQQQVGLINQRISEIPMSPAGEQSRANWLEVQPTGDLMTDLGAYIQAITKDPKSFVAFAAETAAESLPNMAAATAVTLGTGNPVAGAVALGASSAATEMGTAPVDVFRENGVDISTPEGALAAISNPELMRTAIKRGNVRGLVVGMMDGLSGGIAGKMLAESHVGNMVLQSLTQAAMGAAGEAGGQYFSGQEFSLGDVLMEGLAEFATAPVEVVGVGGRKIVEAGEKAKAAADRKSLFEQLSGQAQASLLRGRMPAKFREFVAEATKDGPVENVFVPADKFTEYFQSIGIDPHELVDRLEGVTRDDLDAALAGGGDLQIPTATYAAHIAGSEHDAFLMENMRFDPNEFTSAEAAEFNERANEAMQEAWEVAEQLRQQDEELRSFEQEIYDTMVSRLRAAGRSTDVATTEAMLYPAFYRVMAQRSGLTVEEFMQQYPLPDVRGALPEGMQFKNVDALTRTLAEARATKTLRDKRQTLLEFISEYGGINDVGGELAARDATVINRGKGKKSLRLARKGFVAGQASMLPAGDAKKFGADDVAYAAIERGYMADNPVVQEYLRATEEGRVTPDITAALWDAIDAELAGTPQYSAHGPKDPAIERAEELGDIERYLKEVGVSLDDDDAAIRAALEKADASSFEQFAGLGARTLSHGALAKALLMRAAGSARDDIYAATGFFVGPDGLWRFEISDADAAIRPGALRDAKDGKSRWYEGMLGGLIDHPKLFEAYPILKTIHVRFEVRPDKVEAGVWDGDSIQLRAPTEAKARSILLHEVAHVIQDEEGFASGGNLNMGEIYEGEMVEAFRREALQLLDDWETVDAEYKAAKSPEDRAQIEVLLARIGAEMQAIKEGLEKAARREYYIRLGGEVEARNVQIRDDLERKTRVSGDRRFANFPGGIDTPWWTQDIDPSKVVVIRTAASRAGYEALSIGLDAHGDNVMFQGSERNARGSIQFPAGGVGNGDTIIRLFETSNLSTVAHESGHYFLAVMQDLAMRGEAQATADVQAVREWWRANAADVAKDALRSNKAAGVSAEDVTAWLDNGTTGDAAKDQAIIVGGHEQFARGFEAYLMDGRAPNAELRSVFEKFRAWLVSIYQRLSGLKVNISDDIRRVFDRMIATDEEIAKAQSDAGGSSPVFATAEQLGLTTDEYANLMKLRQQSEDSAKARLLREIMVPIKREKEKWFREERAKVRTEVEKQVNAYPYYRAIEWMGNKRWLGDGQAEDMPDMRLSKEILVARYGAGVLKTLPRGKQTIYTVEGGMDPDEAAGWFGFGSGDEMIQAMERAPKRGDAIDAETDRIMRDRHGDVLGDGELEAKAMEAVHVDKRGQWIAAELKALSEVAERDVALTAKEARASARQTIARMRVRDAIAANRFLAAERRAAEEAERIAAQLARNSVWLNAANRRVEAKARAAAKGKASPDGLAKAIDERNTKLESSDSTFNVPEQSRVSAKGNAYTIPGGERTVHEAGYNELVSKMIDAKRRQLLNHALYTEARKVAEEVEKAEAYVQKLSKKATRERIGGAGRRENASIDYLSAIDAILEQYDFRKISGAAERRRGSLNAFIEAMKAAGRENELAIPESVLADTARRPYKTLPVEHLRGVIDSLKNLEHVATRWDKLIDAQKERNLETVVTEIAEAFEVNVKKRPPGRVKTKGEAIRNAGRQFLDLVLNAGTILREIDGFGDAGAAFRNIKSPIDAAMSRLIVRKEKAAEALEGLYSVYSKKERRDMAVRRHIPALGIALSKWERIAIALNTGNEGNMQRLTDPKVRGSFTEAQVAAILATLDERDADFVQSVWDYVGSFRADIAAREKRTTGIEPKWVDASPVTIAGKKLSGGYYPLRYDPRLSSLARDDQTQEIAQSLQAGRFGKAQTRNGHLKERAQSSGRSVELDMSVLHRHVNQVIYDLELSEDVANSWRILQNASIRDAFTEAGKQADFDALEIWLKDVAEGELRSGDFVNRSARMLKSNFTAAKLAFNLVTVASQVTGLAQTMVVVGKRDFARGVQASLRPGVVADITAKSPFMSTRATTFNKDINDFYNDPKTGPVASRWGDIKSEWIGPAAFWLMTKVQWYLVDIPSWLAGYKQGLRRFGNDETKAIAHADDIVKRSQASGLFSDRSAIERGSVNRTARQNDVVRLFTALGSYMFAKFNVAYEQTGKAARTIQREGMSTASAKEVASWTLDMAFLFMADAVVMAAIRGQLPGGDDDDDKDGWTTFLAKQTGLGVLSTIPFVRDAGSAFQGFDGGGAYGGIVGDFTKGASGLFNVMTAPFSDEGMSGIKPKDIKGILNATGLATGLPATQVNRGIDAMMRSNAGEDVAPLEYILGRRGK
jgi:hypothetical protein